MDHETQLSTCISFLEQLTARNVDLSIKEFRKDPLAAILKSFEENLLNNEISKWFESLSTSEVECEPSTSNGDCSDRQLNTRLRYSQFLSIIYEKLSSHLLYMRTSNPTTDEFTFISLQQLAVLSASVQFFVLSQLIPYLDEGVGIPVSSRSVTIQTWSKFNGDVEVKKEQLLNALLMFKKLMECSEAIKTEIVKRYLSDLFCCVEQLKYLECSDNVIGYFDQLFDQVPRTFFISLLTSLLHQKERSPSWFTSSIGKTLSGILCSPNGLRSTLDAYVEIGGDQFWDNYKILTSFGGQLAVPPSGKKKMAYYENMTSQFVEIYQTGRYPLQSFLYLFATYCDEMRKRDSLASDVFVLDFLFSSWEKTTESKEVLNHSKIAISASILCKWCEYGSCPKVVYESSRLAGIVTILLDLISNSSNDPKPAKIEEIHKNFNELIKYILQKIDEKGKFLMSYLSSTESGHFVLEHKTKLVSVVGEDSDDDVTIRFVNCDNRDDLVMIRLDSILRLLEVLSEKESISLVVELLSESVAIWIYDMGEDRPRFVEIDKDSTNSDWNKLTSHLVVTFCMDRLNDTEIDGSDPKIVRQLMKLVTDILRANRKFLMEDTARNTSFDVRSISMGDEEKEMFDMRMTTIRMAIALSAATIGSATVESELMETMEEMVKEVSGFANLKSNSQELNSIIDEAKSIVNLVKMLGMDVKEVSESVETREQRKVVFDLIEDLKRDLSDPFEAVRGNALLRVGKAVKSRNSRVLDVLDDWLFDAVADLIYDPDSYVFLSAINAMAEVALFQSSKYLKRLLELFTQPGRKKEQESGDSYVIMRGKLAESIGKVFKMLGDTAPMWVNEGTNVFLGGLRDESDIIRASCLSSLSDLVLACRGRGLHNVLAEILLAINQVVKSDPSDLVRRAAIHLLRQCIKTCDSSILQVLGDRLRDIHRSVQWLYKWDKDHVVRLHAQMCLEELKACMVSSIEEDSNRMMRVIKI